MKNSWFILLLSVAWLRAAEAPKPEASAGKTNAPASGAKSEARKEDAEAGHMMYANLPDMKKMQKDLQSFITQ